MAKIKTNQKKFSLLKILLFILSVDISVFMSINLQEKYHGNSNAMTVLVTAFSVLAGFLVAVTALVASNKSTRGGNWRQSTFYLQESRRELLKHELLFYCYLVVLALAFLVELKLGWCDLIQRWAEYALIFFATLSLFWSFFLPRQLTSKHLIELDRAIKERRDKETGPNS